MRPFRRKVRRLATDAARVAGQQQQQALQLARQEQQQQHNAARGVLPRKPEVFDPPANAWRTAVAELASISQVLRVFIGANVNRNFAKRLRSRADNVHALLVGTRRWLPQVEAEIDDICGGFAALDRYARMQFDINVDTVIIDEDEDVDDCEDDLDEWFATMLTSPSMSLHADAWTLNEASHSIDDGHFKIDY